MGIFELDKKILHEYFFSSFFRYKYFGGNNKPLLELEKLKIRKNIFIQT
jgi:hypothetical protein